MMRRKAADKISSTQYFYYAFRIREAYLYLLWAENLA